MGNFFKSLFSSSKAATPEEEKSKNDQKNFDILKYDGVRAQKIGQVAYAIKCFTEALKLQEDFETMTYLVAAYTTANKAEEALEVLNRMVELEPDHINTLLTRVNVLFMLDKDAAYSRTGRDEPFGLVPDGEGEADDFRPLRGYCRPDESDRLERRFHGCLSDACPDIVVDAAGNRSASRCGKGHHAGSGRRNILLATRPYP